MKELASVVLGLFMLALSIWAIYLAIRVAQHVDAWPF